MYHGARHLGKEAHRNGSSGEGEGSSPLRYTEGKNKTSSSVDGGPRVPRPDELDSGNSFACSIASPILSGSLREERKGSWERAFFFSPPAFEAWEDGWNQTSETLCPPSPLPASPGRQVWSIEAERVQSEPASWMNILHKPWPAQSAAQKGLSDGDSHP